MDCPKIARVTQLNGTHRLHVVWDDDTENIVDFKPIIKRFKTLQPLADLDFFSKVAILDGGWTVGWPDNIDYAADILWQRAQQQNLSSLFWKTSRIGEMNEAR